MAISRIIALHKHFLVIYWVFLIDSISVEIMSKIIPLYFQVEAIVASNLVGVHGVEFVLMWHGAWLSYTRRSTHISFIGTSKPAMYSLIKILGQKFQTLVLQRLSQLIWPILVLVLLEQRKFLNFSSTSTMYLILSRDGSRKNGLLTFFSFRTLYIHIWNDINIIIYHGGYSSVRTM